MVVGVGGAVVVGLGVVGMVVSFFIGAVPGLVEGVIECDGVRLEVLDLVGGDFNQ